jgi:bifunctional non-homologous end joining protein LigD
MRRLRRYEKMRDFDVTPEPAGATKRSESGRSFVVQKHEARRLHYDFRLELDGVLLSWAVPKGPSLSTKDKRLAVQTEDHPVDYRDFEGTIPEGEYGAGAVIVWDRGTWEPTGDPHEGLQRGRLDFVVHGEKLRGRYMLVRLAQREAEHGKQKRWMLMKRSDEHVRDGTAAQVVDRLPRSVLSGRTIEEVAAAAPARATKAAELPIFGTVSPQLATLIDELPTRGEWVYEVKYDGYRAIATLDHGHVRIASRNGKDWTDRFAEIAGALSRVRARTAVFDGEIAYVLEDGRTDFQKLQNALGGRADRSRLVYFVFDLLHYDGVDLTGEPLLERKARLRTILAGEKPPLKLGDHAVGDGQKLFAQACKLGLEGIIAKRADAPYRPTRTRDWLKVKCQQRQELVVVGFTPQKGTQSGLGALLLAVREGRKVRFVGKVGTGFTRASLEELQSKLRPLVVDQPTAEGAPRMRDAIWVQPKLVAQVRFTEWTADGALRHPSFEGLREDKPAEAVTRERRERGSRVITSPRIRGAPVRSRAASGYTRRARPRP